MRLKEAFEVHENLNPKLWNEDGTIKEDVREKLVEIVAEFETYIEVPISIVDVQLVGSNASYNYNENSDLDVHIIANFDVIDASEEILQALYNTKKTTFNRTYDIKIHGVEIELYVQDVKSSTVTNGIFSLCDNKWIKEPKPIKTIKKHDTAKEVEKWEQHIKNVISNGSADDIINAINTLYLMRKNSIAVDGEYGKGNQIFKDVRAKGLLNELKDALNREMSRKLSLEGYKLGQLINRI